MSSLTAAGKECGRIYTFDILLVVRQAGCTSRGSGNVKCIDAIPIMYPQERDVTRAALMGEWKLDDKVVTRTWSLAFDLLLR